MEEVSNPIHGKIFSILYPPLTFRINILLTFFSVSAEAIVVDDVGEGGGGVLVLIEEGHAGHTHTDKDDKTVRQQNTCSLPIFIYMYPHCSQYAISSHKLDK